MTGRSFYELDAEGRIVYARDLVEPALKPGSSALLARPAQPGSLDPTPTPSAGCARAAGGPEAGRQRRRRA